MVWQSSNVTAGNEILAEQYNDLRTDVVEVFESAVPVGSVTMWAGGSGDVPSGWNLCDGSAISRSTYSDLYTLLGNTFGAGDGSTTFNVPDMRDRFVIGAGTTYSRNSKGGSNTVNAEHTHTVASHSHSIAQHSHTVSSHRHYTGAHSHSSGSIVAHIFRSSQYNMYLQNVSSGAWGGTHLINLYNSSNNSAGHATAVGTSGSTGSANAGYTDYQAPGTTTAGATSTGNTSPSTGNGGSGSQENRPPYIGIFYIIKIE